MYEFVGDMVCDKCYELMENTHDNFWVCPNCGNSFYDEDYDDDEDDEDEDDDDIPEGCAACGGPYPNCKSSCSLFDD